MNELFTPEFVQLCMSSIVYVQIFKESKTFNLCGYP